MNASVVKKTTAKGTTRFYVVVDKGVDPVTKRRRKEWQKGGHRTRTEAKAAARAIGASLDNGSYVQPSSVTVGDYVESWIAAAQGNGRIRPGTASLYETVLRAYIVPTVGHKSLQELRATDLDRAYAHLLKQGGRQGGPLAAKTVKSAHTLLHKALSDAVKKGLISSNPAEVADSPTPQRKEMKTWTAGQLGQFLEYVKDDRLFAAFRLASMTGMRRAEVLGLRYKDLSLDRGRVSIVQTLVLVGGKPTISANAKTDSGRRSIGLDPETLQALKTHRSAHAEERLSLGLGLTEDDLVFSKVDGTPIHPSWFSRTFTRLSRAAGLPVIRFHDLRHGFATMSLDAGVRVWDVSDILGHKNISITLDLYRHAVPDTQAEATTKVSALLKYLNG
ncbi:MAG: site-specific integrase [Actinomycetota bacterium]